MADGYIMHEWSDDGREQCVYTDHEGRWILRDWCEENFEDENCRWSWRAFGDSGRGEISTLFKFRDLEDALAFKLRWYDEDIQ